MGFQPPKPRPVKRVRIWLPYSPTHKLTHPFPTTKQRTNGPLLAASCILTLCIIGGLEYLCTKELDLIVDNEFVLERAAVQAWSQPDLGMEEPDRVDAVRNAMAHAWHGYEKYAWGADELQPDSKQGKFGVLGGLGGFSGLGASIVDAMSTLHLMGFNEEFERAHAWIAENMTFDSEQPQTISFFETTIRLLGGLMSAYDLSGSQLFLDKAEDLARRIAPAFNSSTGILTNGASLPFTAVSNSPDDVALAECGSNLIEFGTLAARSGNETYRSLAESGMRFLHAKHPEQPLLGVTVNRMSGRIADAMVTIAAPVDSYFEYLLKYWVLTGKRDNHWRDRWINATDTALDVLTVKANRTDGTPGYEFVGDIPYRGANLSPVVTHLGCFYPGSVALGVISGAATGERRRRYLSFAENMMETCFQLYNMTTTGLGADTAMVDVDTSEITITGRSYLQRPEVVESLFYLWRATHNKRYREWGWKIFQAMERHGRKAAGYAGSGDVMSDPPPSDDVQQSWFLAETLKYLYLLFSDDGFLSLDQWVFNTEAHPVRAYAPPLEPWMEWDWLLDRPMEEGGVEGEGEGEVQLTLSNKAYKTMMRWSSSKRLSSWFGSGGTSGSGVDATHTQGVVAMVATNAIH